MLSETRPYPRSKNAFSINMNSEDQENFNPQNLPSQQDLTGKTAQSFGDSLEQPQTQLSSQLALTSAPNRQLESVDFTQLSVMSNRRGDIHPPQRLEAFLQSDIRSQAAALTSEPDTTDIRQTIWGTTVNIEDVMRSFKSFILNYSETPGSGPFYEKILQQMKNKRNYSLNLDLQKLKHYEPETHKLFYQLSRYPQEVIPIMDHVLTEIFQQKYEDFNPDDMVKVRPYNMGKSCNMRDLNPSGILSMLTIYLRY